jgi:hypothetical protein
VKGDGEVIEVGRDDVARGGGATTVDRPPSWHLQNHEAKECEALMNRRVVSEGDIHRRGAAMTLHIGRLGKNGIAARVQGFRW